MTGFDPSKLEDKGDMSRYTMDEGGRIYFDHHGYYPSVSTVLNEMPTPEGVKIWMKNNDDWRDQRDFKGRRGTMVHYHVLDEFYDGNLWGVEERRSVMELRNRWETWDKYEQDRYWCLDRAWAIIRRVLDIRPETVNDVEMYVKNHDVGYGGQFDMLYTDQKGNLVLADLKISSGVYLKHKLQASAYAEAINATIDRMEVIRMDPDKKKWIISTNHDWDRSRADLFEEFCGYREQMADDEIEEIYQEAMQGSAVD